MPSETWVLLEYTLEEAYVDGSRGHATSQEVLQELLVGEGEEFLEVLVSTLVILFGKQEEAVLIGL